MKTAQYWIEKLGLTPHPEGGFYREIYRSPERVPGESLPDRYDGERGFLTLIYFLLRSGDVSHLHRLRSDELWQYQAGAPVTLHRISPNGKYEQHVVGLDMERGEEPVVRVPHGHWFGAMVEAADAYALLTCAVAPGFEFEDFEMADREELLVLCPEHASVIDSLTAD